MNACSHTAATEVLCLYLLWRGTIAEPLHSLEIGRNRLRLLSQSQRMWPCRLWVESRTDSMGRQYHRSWPEAVQYNGMEPQFGKLHGCQIVVDTYWPGRSTLSDGGRTHSGLSVSALVSESQGGRSSPLAMQRV